MKAMASNIQQYFLCCIECKIRSTVFVCEYECNMYLHLLNQTQIID